MRVFVTGASGYIGFAVARAFRVAGHRVWGLARTEKSSLALRAAEIQPVLGEMGQPESYADALAACDVYVHCAFEMTPDGVKSDADTIGTLLKAAHSSSAPTTLLYTSGCWVYGNTGDTVVDESAPVAPLSLVRWRPEHENRVLQASSARLRTMVMRPGCVYGGIGGLTGIWFQAARRGDVQLVGSGDNRWAMIHIQDLATAYVLAAEQEAYNGMIFNVSDGSRNTVRQMCQAVAKAAHIPDRLQHLTDEEAKQIYGPLTEGLAADEQISSARARRLLSWTPKHCNFIDMVDCYYAAWQASHTV